ncbi:hypothetical protein PTTG_10611, partial [Puccinia triticina 1-1 BBBD Race 1]
VGSGESGMKGQGPRHRCPSNGGCGSRYGRQRGNYASNGPNRGRPTGQENGSNGDNQGSWIGGEEGNREYTGQGKGSG